jgi:hypothetical protein
MEVILYLLSARIYICSSSAKEIKQWKIEEVSVAREITVHPEK